MRERLQRQVLLLIVLALLVVGLAHLPISSRPLQAGAPSAQQTSVVVLWNEVMLAAIRYGAPRPTVTARSLWMVHQAMYDAWSLYDPVAQPTLLSPSLRRPARERTEANKSAAVSHAAFQVLMTLYPNYETQSGAFSRLMRLLGYEMVMTAEEGSPAGIGLLAAQAVLRDRATDGANAANNYADVTSTVYPELYAPRVRAPAASLPLPTPSPSDPNSWRSLQVPTGKLRDGEGYPIIDPNDAASYGTQRYLTPHWGAVRPFALASGDQFRPPAPPRFGSDEPYTDGLGRRMTHDIAFRMQTEEILHLSAALTDEQKTIAEYWADGPRSETPPGHWNALAHGISIRDHHTVDDDVKLYFALNGALFDASIGAWDAKRAYNYVRPVSAIRYLYEDQMVEAWGGPNKGTIRMRGENWQPYQDPTFVTPAFPEYVSGHSTFSAAAATVLTAFTGSEQFYDGTTVLYTEDYNRDGLPDLLGQYVAPANSSRFEKSPTRLVVLQWETFQEAADEAGLSRRYGGIHFQDGDLFGRQMGREIGEQAYDRAEGYWTGTLRQERRDEQRHGYMPPAQKAIAYAFQK